MVSFERLIVGVDGSEGSRVALSWAAAQHRVGELIAVHGFSPAEQLVAAAVQVNFDKVRAHHLELLNGDWVSPAVDAGRAPVCEMRDENGANALMAVASSHGSATIVVGHQGHTGWTRLHVGSITGRLLHRCEVPLIVTNPSTEPKPIEGPVIVGISGTADLTSTHLAWAAELGRTYGLRLGLVAVNQPPSYLDPDLPIDVVAIHRANASSMKQLVDDARSRFPDLSIQGEVRRGLPTGELADACEEHAAGMVVVGNHHPSLAIAALSGSILRHLPSLITCPMAAIPAGSTY